LAFEAAGPSSARGAASRHAPVHEVGLEHAAERPPLEVRDLDLGLEQDAVAMRRKAVAQLDVLDLRPGEAPLVVHADGDEDRPSHATAARPERLRLTRLLGVRVVV
jgi:hypothetical protein